MAKVHPKGGKNPSLDMGGEAYVLTVWKQSLMFNCNGFTVFDSKGDMVFRVYNYMHGKRGQIFLMDASGKPLLTIRRKRLSLGDCWVVCKGETALKPQLTVSKRLNILKSKTLVYATSTNSQTTTYNIQGSYSRRCCVVYDANQRKVGELIRKEGVETTCSASSSILLSNLPSPWPSLYSSTRCSAAPRHFCIFPTCLTDD